MSLVGARVIRKEDPNLITGRGQFVDDLQPSGMVFATFVRSTEAHADIRSIDTSAAAAAPGVLGVYTFDDVADLPRVPGLPPEVAPIHRPLLAHGRVRFVGEPIAVVVATDRYRAADAAELVEITYEPLPVLASIDAAMAAMADPDGNRIHPLLQTNALPILPAPEAPSDEFVHAPRHATLRVVNNRCSPAPIETFAVVADWRPDGLVVWASFQAPHHLRTQLTGFFGIDAGECRVIAPDVGGGFGSKINFYVELFLAPWLSRRLRRPVKFAQTRSEAMVHMHHGRGQINEVEVGFDDDGVIHALRVHTLADVGAWPDHTGMGLGVLTSAMAGGCYRIASVQAWLTNVMTNTTPIAAYRGAGRPEAAYLIERTVDLVADITGLDPAEVRRRNFIQPDEFPYATAANPDLAVYDSGNYPAALDELMSLMGYEALQAERQERNADASRPLMGIGLSSWIEIAGFGPPGSLEGFGHVGSWESANLRIQPDGSVLISVGLSPHGQGTHTTMAQIAADELGIDFDRITVRSGDTETVQQGIGTMGSRGIAVCGDAVRNAAIEVRERAAAIAAHHLEANPLDLEAVDGEFRVRGTPTKSVAWSDVALASFQNLRLPEGTPAGSLDHTVFQTVPNFSFPSGAYGCVVGIDRETGQVSVERYVCVDDCGVVVNPLLAEGQVQGGVAQGIAQALFEEMSYNDDGQPTTTNFIDYLVPSAADLPCYEMGRVVTRTPVNSLGAKGIGESGAVGAPPAVVNAVVDALASFGVRHIDMPVTPEKVWRAMSGPPDGTGSGTPSNGTEA